MVVLCTMVRTPGDPTALAGRRRIERGSPLTLLDPCGGVIRYRRRPQPSRTGARFFGARRLETCPDRISGYTKWPDPVQASPPQEARPGRLVSGEANTEPASTTHLLPTNLNPVHPK